MNGASGIPVPGREKDYATELWLDGPSAFWLHPEGPLSDTTPDEWRAKQPNPPVVDPIMQRFAAAGLAQSAAANQGAMLQNVAMHQRQLMTSQALYDVGSLLGALPFGYGGTLR